MNRERPLDDLKRELWLERRLREHGVRIMDGVTDAAERKRRARAAIVDGGLGGVICGRRAGDPRGKPVTYAQAFELVFGEALEIAEAA